MKHENEKGKRKLFRRKATHKTLGIGSYKRVRVLIPLNKSKDIFFCQSTQALFSVRLAYLPKAGLEEIVLHTGKSGVFIAPNTCKPRQFPRFFDYVGTW